MSGATFTWTFTGTPTTGTIGPSQGIREALYCHIEYEDIRAKPAQSKGGTANGQLGGLVRCDVLISDSPDLTAQYTAGTRQPGDGRQFYGLKPQDTAALQQLGPTASPDRANVALFVHPRSKDMAFDSSGRELGMDPIQQRIQILLDTQLGSIDHDQAAGLEIPKKITPDVGRQLAVFVQRALKPMLDDGTIRLRRITAYYQQ